MPSRTAIGAEDDARAFIRAKVRGVYAWVGRSGFMKVGPAPPTDVDFVELRGDGFSLLQDTAIPPPSPHLGWHVSLRRWPRRQIKVEYASPESRSGVNWIEVLLESSSWWPD
jgi:hypothetical protein